MGIVELLEDNDVATVAHGPVDRKLFLIVRAETVKVGG